jgi:hypothetical protein
MLPRGDRVSEAEMEAIQFAVDYANGPSEYRSFPAASTFTVRKARAVLVCWRLACPCISAIRRRRMKHYNPSDPHGRLFGLADGNSRL